VLRRVHLISDNNRITDTPTDSLFSTITTNNNGFGNLDSEVKENSSNLFRDQRQLIRLARALLKNPKIIIIDEATATVDNPRDTKIQATIRERVVMKRPYWQLHIGRGL
jgi:ABC-type multidrug transport system fused ATPase/permease subunit